jgi:hypothetical protein
VKGALTCPGFPLRFRCRHSLFGHPVPAGELGLPCGRLTGPTVRAPTGVATFRTLKLRPGRAPSIARGRGALSRPTTIIGLRLAYLNAVSLHRATASIDARLCFTSHQPRVHTNTPVRPSPRPTPPDGTRASSAFPELRTPRLLAAHVGAGTDHRARIRNQRYGISRTSNLADLLDACDLASHS